MISYFNEKQSSNFGSSKKFWTFYKTVVKTKKSSQSTLIPNIIDSNNISYNSPTDIANTFNLHFTNLHPNSTISDDDTLKFIDNSFQNSKRSGLLTTGAFSFRNFSESEVVESLKALNTSSASGIMLIPTSVLKHCALTLAPILTSLFNNILQQGAIPDECKCAIVFPLFKKGDPTLCDNYRGISVLSPLAKTLERLISIQITNYFESSLGLSLFSSSQHGFRRNFSCETAIQ